ncbi:MAG TPA: glycosyltransferase family 2 protein [Chitinophagaceae bacterium]|nr:glycosyltransferase family 2 protein [Chitinophagaceae bacterium]HUM64201.1 glycosyltransferase family 2 protein [Chitinophagaceae bacterium]
MELLSVVIITYNEEKNIGRCLDSVKDVADEIVVLDSYSTDATVQIAESKGATVYRQKFAGYISQKNKALELATHHYVLSLDADEALDETLKMSILKAKEGFAFRAYKMNRCANYRGSFIRHGSWYPEAKVRLFDRRFLRWGGFDPHDRVIVPSNVAVCPLKGDLLHYICESVDEHKKRNDNFSTIAARSLYRLGKKTNWLKIVASPTWSFLYAYLFRAGFLNGYNGLMIAYHQARYHFLKYAKLYSLQKSKTEIPRAVSLNIQPATNTERLTRDVGAHV